MVIFEVVNSNKMLADIVVEDSFRNLTGQLSCSGDTISKSTLWTGGWTRSHWVAYTMQLELVTKRAFARASTRRATCASHAAHADGHEDMRGVPGRVRIAIQCHAVSERSTSMLAHPNM